MFSFSKISNIFSKIFGYLKFKKNIPNKINNFKPMNKSLVDGNISYMINDPFYPDMIIQIKNPVAQGLNFNVKYYIGYTEGFSSLQGKAANVYALLCHGINIFNKKLKLRKWSVVNNLVVDPVAGEQANAYYDRNGIRYFYFTKNGKSVYTCLSSDIVSHELGHALLDAIRPDLFSVASMEVWAFHEAFGDICSIICTLNFDVIIDYMLNETKGDLRQNNIVSKLAEEMGTTLGHAYSLRNAYNSFKYTNPSTLPTSGDSTVLINEPHSFSRVFSGLFYEILCEIYEAKGRNKESLIAARDYLFDTFLDTCLLAPATPNFFETFCHTWLSVDAKYQVSYKDILNKVFANRNIFKIQSMGMTDFDEKTNKEQSVGYTIENLRIEKFTYTMTISELMPDVLSAQSVDLLGNLKVQLPVDEMHMEHGEEVFKMCSGINASIECARGLIAYITDKNLFGDSEGQNWTKDKDNNLVRKYFNCDCFMPNYLNPQSPEYGKKYKQENNSGCCAYGSCANQNKLESIKIEKSCNLRYHSSCGYISYKNNC